MRDFFSTAQIGKINKTYINKDLYLYNIDLVINNILQIYLHFEPSAKNTTLIFFFVHFRNHIHDFFRGCYSNPKKNSRVKW